MNRKNITNNEIKEYEYEFQTLSLKLKKYMIFILCSKIII